MTVTRQSHDRGGCCDGYLLPVLSTTVEQYLLIQCTPAMLPTGEGHLLVSLPQQQCPIQRPTAVGILLLGDTGKCSEGGRELRTLLPVIPKTTLIQVSTSPYTYIPVQTILNCITPSDYIQLYK